MLPLSGRDTQWFIQKSRLVEQGPELREKSDSKVYAECDRWWVSVTPQFCCIELSYIVPLVVALVYTVATHGGLSFGVLHGRSASRL